MAAPKSNAQYLADALRFSQFQNSTTARFDALGGYKSSLGGDINSLYGNPAGLGMFSKSEFSITPSLKIRNNNININDKNKSANSSNIDLDNVGVVFHAINNKKGDLNKGLISLNFGIGYQKRNAFRNDFQYDLTTNSNGLGDFFAETASSENKTQANLSSLVNGAAYDSFLINSDANDATLYVPNTSTNSKQNQSLDRSGGSSNVDFSLGANISNTLFVGLNLGLSSFKYASIEKTKELGLYSYNNTNFDYDVDYYRNFDTEGSGINLKLGMILRPISALRIGLSFESPTWFTVVDNYSEQLQNNIDNISGTDNYAFDYELRTPAKLNTGISYFFGNKGFLTADIGFVDYSTIKFTSTDSPTNFSTNTGINQNFKNTINYSIGGEFKIQPDFSIRLGYQFQGNPYKNLNDSDFEIDAYTAGFGYKFGPYYIDMALVNSDNNLYYSNYTLNNNTEPSAKIATKKNTASLTFGVKF